FRSFKEKVLSARGEWRLGLFGLSNLALVKAGIVQVEDLVEGDRVLDLAEVVGKKKLTVDQLVAAGLNPPVAAKAVALARIRAAAAARSKSARPAVKVGVP